MYYSLFKVFKENNMTSILEPKSIKMKINLKMLCTIILLEVGSHRSRLMCVTTQLKDLQIAHCQNFKIVEIQLLIFMKGGGNAT